MKLITAIIPSHKLEEVVLELDLVKIYRKTVTNVLGVGESRTEVYRATQETGNLVRKIRLDIAVNDNLVETVVNAIIKGTKSDNSEGKIFIVDLVECIHIGTGKRGSEAIGQ
jgi:nitrogen regulatory protein P-II 2